MDVTPLKFQDKIYKGGWLYFVMDGWMNWTGKFVFIRTRHSRVYSGEVVEVDDTSGKPLVWITIIDKFGNRVTFLQDEIVEIKEEARV